MWGRWAYVHHMVSHAHNGGPQPCSVCTCAQLQTERKATAEELNRALNARSARNREAFLELGGSPTPIIPNHPHSSAVWTTPEVLYGAEWDLALPEPPHDGGIKIPAGSPHENRWVSPQHACQV